MLDIVTHTMPAESDVHVARNFLTKILRSSMRKNRFKGRNKTSSRPHSWHSKSAENPITDIPKSEADPGAESTRPTKHDRGSPSKDYTSCWGQTNLGQVSCQFSSVRNIESVEPIPHAFSKGLQSNKPNAGLVHSVVEKGLNKTDLGITSTEGMFYRGSPNELGVTNDCHRYAIPVSSGGFVSPSVEDHSTLKFSSARRSNPGLVWHIPDMKPTNAPTPPLRSDSFTATRVHETGLVGSFPEEIAVYSSSRTMDRHVGDIHARETGREARHSYNSPPNIDVLHPYLSVEDCNSNKLNPSKAFSHSSTDVRQAQNPFAYEVQHQRQQSAERPFAVYPSTTSNTQSVESYYRSLQDLPTNSCTQNPPRTSTTFDYNHLGQANFRYYCITSQQPCQESTNNPQGLKQNGRRTEGGTMPAIVGSQKSTKTKYSKTYINLPENYSSNGRTKQAINSPTTEATSPRSIHAIQKSSSGERKRDSVEKNIDRSGKGKNHPTEGMIPFSSPSFSKQEEKICPYKTPMLYSLAQESKKKTVSSKVAAHQETTESIGCQLGRRSDRYATTLRKEIQQKKAQLQKSRSAANLICSSEVEDQSVGGKSNETSTSSSDGSFNNTYKDHLKEAQAKVLKATSFMRRDLELHKNEALTGQPLKNGQLIRIGGRKRFFVDKRLQSFSEPDKINEVGVEEKAVGSFVDRYQFFEDSCKPNFQKPILKKSLPGPREKSEDIPKAPLRQSQSSHSDLNFKDQRLETFAEFEATWNMQKRATERRNKGRYHSAENILDSGLEQSSVMDYVHERSRSSPSADIHSQKIIQPPDMSSSQHQHQQETCVIRKQSPVYISEPITLIISQNEDMKDPTSTSSHYLQVPVSDQLCHKNTGTEQRSVKSRTEMITHLSPPQRVSPVRITSEPTESLRRRCSSPDLTETLEKEISENHMEECSLVLGHSSISSQQNNDNRTQSPSHMFYTKNSTDEIHPHISCKSEEMSEINSTGQKLNIRNPFEREIRKCVLQNEPSVGWEECKTAQVKNTNTDQSSSEHYSSDPKKCSEEDLKREELVRDIMGKDKSLVEILDQSKMKTTMDLMEGIFPRGEHIQQRRKNMNKHTSVKNIHMRLEESASVCFLSSSSYYSTSAPKAELLIKMKDMQEHMNPHDSEDELDSDLSCKKQELMESLSRKLQVLREARASLREDVRDNNFLGEEVEATVRSVCRPNELEKFCMFVGDLDKVVSLLLSLSGRLARVENALNHLEEETSAEEKQTLMEKRKLLILQHEDAKELKENLDRRERLVHDILSRYFSEEHLADYQHFVKMKSALIIEQRKLEDKIKLGEEQLKCLKDSLPLDQRLLY